MKASMSRGRSHPLQAKITFVELLDFFLGVQSACYNTSESAIGAPHLGEGPVSGYQNTGRATV